MPEYPPTRTDHPRHGPLRRRGTCDGVRGWWQLRAWSPVPDTMVTTRTCALGEVASVAPTFWVLRHPDVSGDLFVYRVDACTSQRDGCEQADRLLEEMGWEPVPDGAWVDGGGFVPR